MLAIAVKSIFTAYNIYFQMYLHISVNIIFKKSF